MNLTIQDAGLIKQLDKEIINRIAAGEIIQGPSNACKELIENSLDAKANSIVIVVKNGGLKLLQVEDNGTGIHYSNLDILCERFTTSKLRAFEDLPSIGTFGFRGEALASISHVAHLTVQTKIAEDPLGYTAVYENGKLIGKPKRCAAKQGTIIRIEDLFYNMPQRRHCLRSPTDEYKKICDVFCKYAVHNSSIAFMLKKFNEPATIKTLANSNKEDNIRSIYGTQIANNLFPLEIENNEIGTFKMRALLTYPKCWSKSSNFIIFINNRLAECNALRTSVQSVYSAYIPKGTHPFAYFDLEMDPFNVDVNVHPTKQQVNFLYEKEIIQIITSNIETHLFNCKHTQTLYKQLKLPGVNVLDVDKIPKNASKTYDKDMVRTDAKQQKLQIFLRHRNLKASSHSNKLKQVICNREKMQKHGKKQLSSIIRIQNRIEGNVSTSFLKVIKGLVFVGTIDNSFALFQHQTSLFVCNLNKLSEELFYQLLIKNFQEFVCLKLQPKLPINNLIAAAVNCKYTKWTGNQKKKFVKKSTLFLISKAQIMKNYFGICINFEGELITLPVVLPNHYPNIKFLPMYLLRLTTKVDWKSEEKCFDTFSRETARFYAQVSDFEYKNNVKELKWMEEHIIYPALRRLLKPGNSLKKHLYELTTLPKLYKVFERC